MTKIIYLYEMSFVFYFFDFVLKSEINHKKRGLDFMNKKTLFVVLLAMLCLAVSVVTVSADQNGTDRWCNSDLYGCWVTGEEGEQIYIMFWSVFAREYFMGPDSNATVTDPYPIGKMPLDPPNGPSAREVLMQKLYDIWLINEKLYCEKYGYDFDEEYAESYKKEIASFSEKKIEEKIKSETDYYNRITKQSQETPSESEPAPEAESNEPATREDLEKQLYDLIVANERYYYEINGKEFNESEYMNGFDNYLSDKSDEFIQKRIAAQLDYYNEYVNK